MSTGIAFRAIPTVQLVANPRNVREELTGIEELAASIRANGILQPLIVNDQRGNLVVTDGHRRLAAARLAMVPAVPCLVTTGAGNRQVVTTMLASAMHKELAPIEQARAFASLRKEGLTPPEIARATGYTLGTVKNRLLLLELPADAQRMVEDKEISLGQATQLAKQVKARGAGSARKYNAKSAWFKNHHRLAGVVSDTCTHRDDRVVIGSIGCGECWEDAIRADERGQLAPSAVVDQTAVQRALDGDRTAPLRPHERDAVISRLVTQRRMNDQQIARFLGVTDRTVLRTRQDLGLDSPVSAGGAA